ncbi:protein CELLULOSE SYNTHASE INTERACTIVE 3 isoform X1 [Sesamum indicum]|uniref:Protein CELLULOSE SYNTHASE INTERACTIVE 3 isoform X1 n=2 Tax=Sesamum indicum TaxID=4182 RepID=A0A6I9SJG2_SESIN|nr:protein CELLULOSE SYNTHASE INTERACTIVE 3 isoform X1 [Sesamum indicum]XP_011069442.1 protein CELLULOSE SYNTHASE INTERACTIVE 3 isoform X1 [Sesamum indicum]XP_011069447.1 protein CELLULOSE SYNTHASE INTERACTIVE 3 isoform X1 [Sesamum indicum]XP_011069454.1 protein CELLULOSE SYNTHASE INTERACTIVE 3 isoform X1 [Sesamum indicum]XP_020547409.1 protein CELLULOSE SYNTHASE INTERACTIVE 3 isoform X1 [Sesamum indicum]
MSKLYPAGSRDPKASSLSRKDKESNGTTEMDEKESMLSRVAQLIEQLHSNVSSPQERELTTARLLGIAKARKEARGLIGSHGQAMPLFVSILRNGTLLAKINVAATLSVLCKDEDLRIKVLLGGCIPPLLSLLKSDATEARKVAAEALYVVSSGVLSDHVGMKIFITEGVVPTLWEQLSRNKKQDKVVEGFVTGALRNLCGDKDGYWRTTLDAGGVDIIVGLLSSGNPTAQSNAASLLACLMLGFADSIPKIIGAGAIKTLLGLLGQHKDASVRASAAEALEALSLKSTEAKQAIVDAQGMPVLIGAIVAPSKEGMQGEWGQALQQHSTQALANICGGMSALLLYLGELSQSPRLAAPVADIIGALAYALMVFKQSDDEEPFESTKIESILIILLKPRDNKLVQERLLEAMASLYSNPNLSVAISQSEAKKVLIGLITMATGDAQEYLILALIHLCTDTVSVWEALGKREGIQMLISSLGLSSEQHQEYAVEMLAILTEEVDDSKWAITAAGGIPPLVQLIEVGSQRAREGAACVLWKLGCHSEDIRACVESSGAIPALLWLLKIGVPNEQEASAKALIKLTRTADSATINQLLALLFADSPSSKAHIIKVLGHVLSTASHSELVHKGTTANTGLRSLVQVLNSSDEKTQEYAASVLADLFSNRQDICDSLATDEVINPCIKLLTSKTQGIVTQSARALSALSRPTKTKIPSKMSYIAEGDVQPLIKLAKTASMDSAESAMAALANLLSNRQVAAEALAEDVVSAITRVLGEGSLEGKKSAACALYQLLKHFPVGDVLIGRAQCRFAVLAVVDSLNAIDMDYNDAADALDVVSLLARTKQGRNSPYLPWSALSEVPSSLEPLVRCLCEGPISVQDKVIEILSRLSRDQPVVLGNLLISNSRAIGALASRITKVSSLEVRVGGIALLICAAKEHKIQSVGALEASGYMKPLIYALVDMIKQSSSLEFEITTPRGFTDRSAFQDGDDIHVPDPATVLGGTVALWLLSIISSSHSKHKITVMEAGGLEALSEKLAEYANKEAAEFGDTEGVWISAVLAAVLFQDANVVSAPMAIHFVPSLAILLKSDEMIDRYFAAQAMASLVCYGNKGINLAIANSGAVAGLTTLIGHLESNMLNLIALSEEFSLIRNPDQVVLESLFLIDDVRVGSVARKTIPLLVDLLRPLPDRPGAPPFAVRLLTQIADGNDANKLLMAEAGALDALSKYLSLSPQDLNEATISELLRILFSNPDLLQYEAAASCMDQLIAVLHLGSRSARLSAARALNELFDADNVRDSESSIQAIQPLADMLDTTSECEQQAALSALVKLTSDCNSRAAMLAEVEGNPLHSICKILSSASTWEMKSDAAELCCVLFDNPRVRELPIVSECIEPLILLMQSDKETAIESGVCAFERLLDDEKQVEIPSDHDVVGMLVGLVSGSNHRLIEASICALIKLGKDRTPRKLDMVNAGIIDNCLELLPTAPTSLCAMIAELFRILTNSSAISKSSAAAKIVEPLFMVLLKTDFGLWGQHSALQALVNILEKPQSLSTLKLTPSQVIEPLISFLESPLQAIQQLGTELLSHLLEQEHFKQDITTKSAVVPLVQLAGIGILNLQQTAIKALENISLSLPKAVCDAGGIFELSKVIIQDDPLPPEALWESAALVLSNLLRSDAEYYLNVPAVALVKMLHSTVESTVKVALNALTVQEKTEASSAELMVEAGAIDALLDLLRSHQCEEASGRLLEALFNNARVRGMKASKYAIAPLSQYLLDPQTKSQIGRLLAALALGDLSQHEGLARATDSVFACRALVSLLEDQPTEEMKMVAICALQNLVMRSRTNRRAVAESGGILVIQEQVLSQNSDVAAQAALLIKFLFSNHTLQEYVSNELIRSLTAALERELWSTATVNEEVLRTIHVIFSNFHKLHMSEAATLCIPHLVTALKSGSEAAQDSILTTLCLLKQSWSTMPLDLSKSQAMVAAEAIPVLQMLMKTCPPSFHERVENLLNCLPGCLTVTIKRANNLKHVLGGTHAYCRLTIGSGPARQTKVVSHNTSPEWKEAFTWAFDVPPKGQKLHISCRSRSTFGKTSLGRVTIKIDKVVNEGVYSGVFGLSQGANKDSSSRTLEIEITWSNRMSNESV